MGARCVGHGVARAPPRFWEANVKSLILTIGALPDLYYALPVLLMCPPSFHSHRAPMNPAETDIVHDDFPAPAGNEKVISGTYLIQKKNCKLFYTDLPHLF